MVTWSTPKFQKWSSTRNWRLHGMSLPIVWSSTRLNQPGSRIWPFNCPSDWITWRRITRGFVNRNKDLTSPHSTQVSQRATSRDWQIDWLTMSFFDRDFSWIFPRVPHFLDFSWSYIVRENLTESCDEKWCNFSRKGLEILALVSLFISGLRERTQVPPRRTPVWAIKQDNHTVTITKIIYSQTFFPRC